MSDPSTAQVVVQDRTDPEMALVLDPASLDPNLHYRFVQDRPTNLAKMKARGYRYVSRTKDKVKTLVELEQTADDTIRHADMVLMYTSKEAYHKRQRNKASLVRDRLEATHESFKEKVAQAQAAGVDVRLIDKYDQRGEPTEKEGEE